MQKVVEYDIIWTARGTGLATMVNDAIQSGWVPSGPVVAYKERIGQAMVKFEPEVSVA